ncbi:hypothetical protein SULI_07630 [Saccharolobus solfataricus]|uniref:Tetratricopeptide repeat protein n=3 Tax=Saccharolobus solfataricus TaxID=2287 RepID=Q97ZS3_SACS2|nr:hypothetical protein [Saccharolobus solfataricus]AAK40826.1 Conserved hypothetical protein [Saccharolobus solfataricus P2]AKA73801.1 hypothetical protein SULB_1533 [Saccharolobus solfataricus]AKA76498.1 hypothetical protein SULC_1531 [Saccharolobus solfataricus]AKA79191.1 hypothetical protein SULA_1532 [Saccharolobus solfataricus]AZF68277.1 hypothetical protein SULG_07630 [Saccharolobus solfataricus]
MERIVELEEQIKKERNKEKRNTLYISLIQEYHNLYKKYKNTEFLDRALSIANKIEKKNPTVLNILGLIYLEKRRPDIAILTFKELLSNYNLNNEDKNVILYNLSLAYFQKGELLNAYNTLKGLVLNSRGEINVLSKKLLVKVCLALGEIRYIEEARELLEEFNIPSEELAIAYAALAKYYNDNKLLKKAKDIAIVLGNEKILADILSISDDEEDLRKAIQIYEKLGDHNSELKPLYKLSNKDPSLFAQILEKIGNLEDSKDKLVILYDIYRRTKILQFLKEAIKTAEKLQDYLFLARAYSELANYEEEVTNLRKAISFYEKYIEKSQK